MDSSWVKPRRPPSLPRLPAGIQPLLGDPPGLERQRRHQFEHPRPRRPRPGAHLTDAASTARVSSTERATSSCVYAVLSFGTATRDDQGVDSEDRVDQMVRAAEEGDVSQVTRLLGEGVPVDEPATSGRGFTALDIAVRRGHTDVVRVLVEAGADPDQPVHDYGEHTPLTLAASNGRTDMVAVLLDAGAHPDTPSRDGNSLMSTVTSTAGRVEIVDLLLDHGADIHLPTKGRTPLEWAAAAGKPQMVHHLLARGAVPTAKAVRVARTWGNNTFPETWPDFERAIELLRAAGTDISTAP